METLEAERAYAFGVAESENQKGQDQPGGTDPTVQVDSLHKWFHQSSIMLSPTPKLPDSFHSDSPAEAPKHHGHTLPAGRLGSATALVFHAWGPTTSSTTGRHVCQTCPAERLPTFWVDPRQNILFSIIRLKCLFSYLKTNPSRVI